MAQSEKIGLALSGGGFRATLFHLGVTRALAEAGLLGNTSHIVAVSGGSVLGAHLVLNWSKYRGTFEEFEDAAEPLLKFLESDVRNRILRRLPWGMASRVALRLLLATVGRVVGQKAKGCLLAFGERCTSVDQLRGNYARLFRSARLENLADQGPELAILATEAASMKHAWFTSHGFGQPADGVTPTRAVGRDLLSVALSVAASSAFPALFPPVRLDGSTFHFDAQSTDRYVTDAGVYDNLGVSGFLGEPFGGAVSPVFVSDATATIKWTAEMRLNLFSNLFRSVDIIQQRAAELQRRAAGLPHRDTRAGKAAPEIQADGRFVLFDIARQDIHTDPKVSETVQMHLSYIRTDLDAFSTVEMRALVHHGYSVAWHGLKQAGRLPEAAQSRFPEWRDRWPRPKPADETTESEVAQVIRAGRSRTRFFWCRDPVGALNLAVVLLILLGPLFGLWWERNRAARELAGVQIAAQERTAQARQHQEQERMRGARDRITAYLNLQLPTLPIVGELAEAPQTGDPRYDGLVITSLDKVFDLRKWVRVPAEKRDTTPLEAATQQTVYNLQRDERLTNVTFVLKTTGYGVFPDVPDGLNFRTRVFRRQVPNAQDHYFKHVLIEIDLMSIPPHMDFPLVVRSTFWNAFQKDVEDAAFKAYSNAQRATMVVLFPKERIPARFNFWRLSRDGNAPQLLRPPPFYTTHENGLFFEIEQPTEGSTYGVVFTWDDQGGTGPSTSVMPTLAPDLKPF